MARELKRWIVARQRPDEGAPSLSIGVRAGSTNVALIRFLERYPDHPQGSRIVIRTPERDDAVLYVRGRHMWEARYPSGAGVHTHTGRDCATCASLSQADA